MSGARTPGPMLRVAKEMAAKMLHNRKGHGGGACSYRTMREEQLIAFAVLVLERAAAPAMLEALEADAEWYEYEDGGGYARVTGGVDRDSEEGRRLYTVYREECYRLCDRAGTLKKAAIAQARGEEVGS